MTQFEKAFLHGWCAGGLFVGAIQLLSDAKYMAASCLIVYSTLFMIALCRRKLDRSKNKRDTSLAEMKPLNY